MELEAIMRLLLSFVALFCVTSVSVVRADIAPPPGPSTNDIVLEGDDALDLYNTLNVRQQIEAELRTGTRSVKVFRADSGLSQIVCHRTVKRGTREVDGECTIQQSTDGRELPKYVVTRIVG
jgi:hypothetical protein